MKRPKRLLQDPVCEADRWAFRRNGFDYDSDWVTYQTLESVLIYVYMSLFFESWVQSAWLQARHVNSGVNGAANEFDRQLVLSHFSANSGYFDGNSLYFVVFDDNYCHWLRCWLGAPRKMSSQLSLRMLLVVNGGRRSCRRLISKSSLRVRMALAWQAYY